MINFGNIFFILVKPQMGENIGASARVIKNFRFENFRIVKPRDKWPNKKAISTSVGAKDLVHNSKIYKDVNSAVKDLHVVFGTTSRIRSINKINLSLKQAIKIIIKNLKNNKKIGLLFGSEASGLSNEDLVNANYLMNIPTNKNFSSLNLSHAIAIIAYELFSSLVKKNLNTKTLYRSSLASKKELNNFLKFLIKRLEIIGFLKPKEKKTIMIQNIKNTFQKSSLSSQEIRTLLGIVSSLIKYKGNLH
ncbi:MAG: RNA methyltransferase [Candidatus Fonsibacter sp.]